MTAHTVVAARGRSLMNSLGALGLVRLLADQADRSIRCHYVDCDLTIETSVADVPAWLVDHYIPTPILSPWNEGSGFGLKDKAPKDALRALLAVDSPRLDPFRRSMRAIDHLATQSRKERWDKPEFIRQLRNQCPDAMLVWLDAAVVVIEADKLAFPPLLGTGGNDGRLDFSTNFHQRLLEILPISEESRQRSIALVRDWMTGTAEQPLSRAAVGQFDPGGAGTPNSSPYGGADSVVNPWAFTLMVEGATMFAAAPARRFSGAARQNPRAAMTFTTFGSPHGSSTGSDAEETRGEVWFPWWEHSLSWPDITQLFSEGRAVWRGRTAIQSSQMYLATGSLGVSRGVTGFDRYTFARRNGLAFSAVLTDSVTVHLDESLQLVSRLEDWPNRVARLADTPGTIKAAVRRFERARVAMARENTDSARLVNVRELLQAVTELDLAVARSGNTRTDLSPRSAPAATEFLKLLSRQGWLALPGSAEFRLALGLASTVTGALPDAPGGRSMREILLPLDPPDRSRNLPLRWRDSAIVTGFGLAPVADIIAGVASWTMIARTDDPPGHLTNEGLEQGDQARQIHGTCDALRGIAVPAWDLHAWVHGALDETELAAWFTALLAFDWRRLPYRQERATATVPDPTLALIAPFRDGLSAYGDSESARYGLTSEWVAQLRAGQVRRVHIAVGRRLRQLGYDAVQPAPMMSRPDAAHGTRIAAALVPRAAGLHTAFERTTRPLRAQPELPADQSDTTDDRPPAEETL